MPHGTKEILNNGQYGELFNVGDYNQLYKLLKSFNNKSKKIRFKISQGYKSLARFDHKSNCRKYFQIISKYLKKNETKKNYRRKKTKGKF